MIRISRRKLLAASSSLLLPATAKAAFEGVQTNGLATSTLPAGVTLQAIDGETMTSATTMSNNYYTRNGFTNAVTAGWDNPSFYPIGAWFGQITNSSDAARWVDLGLNTLFYTTATTSTAQLAPTNPIYLVDGVQGAATPVLAVGNYTIGILTYDEPGSYSAGVSTPLGTTANATQDGRFWWVNNTWNFIEFGPPTGTPSNSRPLFLSTNIATPNATLRHINQQSVDLYWISFSKPGNSFGGSTYQGGLIYGLGGSVSSPGMTLDQAARPSHYGDMIDQIRQYQTTYPAPIFTFVENGQPDNQSPSSGAAGEYYISPPQMNAAFWSAIMHGCRGVIYFNNTFDPSNTTADNFSNAYYTTIQSTFHNWGTLGGAARSISIYNQAKATNAAIQGLAPVINSPFAINYASVSPAGWTYGAISLSLTGFDVMAKYYNHQFYVFAMPRYSQTLTNQTATFTLAGTGNTTATVVNESRSIPISGQTFTDTFADGNTVHIYQIT